MARTDEPDDAVLGVAISTGNYRALLAAASTSYAATTTTTTNDGYNDNTVVGLPVATRNYRALLHQQPAEATAIDDNTVVGLPVSTRNYVALVNHPPPPPSNQQDTAQEDENENDDDAVLGLPISTGNYTAMYRNDGKKVRPRGYSDLAGPSRDRDRERVSSSAGRRSTPEYGIAASSGAGSSRSKPDSCFDTRRTSGAVVPHKGWLYIQSPTLKAWKRYFAVLSGLDFRYGSEPGRPSKGFGMVQSVQVWEGKPCGLKFVYSSGSEVPAYGATEAERDEWIEKVNRALDKLQNWTGHSKTSYTLAADQHEGYLYKQERSKNWQLSFFTLRNDGYMQCRDDANTPVDARSSGFVKSVAFADMHPNALAIQLVSGNTVFVYTDSYDDRMLWYAAISAAASKNDKTPPSVTAIKSSYVQTALPNYSGWLYKQMGLFKSWKRVYVTMHGLELAYSRDVNSPVEECDKIRSVEGWDGKQHGLQIQFASGQSWKVHAESYETAKHWRNVIAEACRHSDRFNIKRYIISRKRKNQRPVFGGWLTVHKNGSRIRQFYVLEGNMLGVADDVDNLLQPIGSVVDIGATRDTANGMLAVFADGSRMKISGDSVESAKAWYDCLSASL